MGIDSHLLKCEIKELAPALLFGLRKQIVLSMLKNQIYLEDFMQLFMVNLIATAIRFVDAAARDAWRGV